jgi:hypothetical protein
MPIAKSISKLLAPPSKVAHALDWRKVSGSILSMSIVGDRIDLAVAFHPSSSDSPQSLPSIPLKTQVVNNKKVLAPGVAEELSSLMKDWEVCGLVVNWPVQKEGWAGYSAGKTLFALDQLTSVLSPSRPVCLWDEEHHVPYEDEWGRSPIYAEASSKTTHKASEEQYKPPSTVAADVWNDFCRAHWPELYYSSSTSSSATSSSTAAWSSKAMPQRAKTTTRAVDVEWLDSYEDTSAYTKAAL